MTSNELKELVKSHFSLVEADATEETINENFTEESTEEVVEEVAEVFGEIADENSAFVLKFPGDELEVGDKVVVVTTEGQEMDAPDGEHKLVGGVTIVTKDSIVESISKEVEASAKFEEDEEDKEEEMMEEKDAEEVSIEAIVEAIVSEVKDEMAKIKEKMYEIEEKVVKVMDVPATESAMKSTPKKAFSSQSKNRAPKFNVETAANAGRIKLALSQIKK